MTQKVAKPDADEQRPPPVLVGAGAAQVGAFRAAKEPRRAIVRLTPKAKDSSLPRNHLAIAVVTATMSDSAPSPKTSRPAAITASVPLTAVSAAPSEAQHAEEEASPCGCRCGR